jgi:tetratricopeptide (TPR) repeat protein
MFQRGLFWPSLIIWLVSFAYPSSFSNAPTGGLVSFTVYAPNSNSANNFGSVGQLWSPFYFVTPDSICGISHKDYLQETEEQIILIWQEQENPCFIELPLRLLFVKGIKELQAQYGGKGDKNPQKFLDNWKALRKKWIQKSTKSSTKQSQTLFWLSLEINLGVLEILTQQGEKAKETFSKMHRRDSSQGLIQKNLFSLYISLGSLQKADELLEATLEQNPKTIWAQERKLYLIQSLGSPLEYQQYMKQRVSWKDSLFAVQIAYGLYLKERGDVKKAIDYLERGLEGAPNNASAWLRLGELYLNQGDIKRLEVCIERAFEMGVQDPFYFELGAKLLRERVYSISLRSRAYEKRIAGCEYRGVCVEKEKQSRAIDVDTNLVRLRGAAESAFSQGPHSRNLAQVLYWIYGSLGDFKSQETLKETFWFHFQEPYPKRHPLMDRSTHPPETGLEIRNQTLF